VPAHVIIVTEFPLTTSGKIDRAALPAPTPQPATHAGTAAASSTSEPPASFTESLLADLYARVLGTAPAATTDSFFDLGGSSLQVMRLVDLIYRELRVDAGVSTVFAHPTPRQLAARIDALRAGAGPQDGAGTPDGPLVRLGDGAGELPLYLIHAVGGTVWDYRRLAAELAGTFAVHGLQAPAFATAPAPTPLPAATSLAALVTSYTRLIQAAQPAGPYRLAGWSMGGTLAFEIARRLEQAGQPVALLGLLDAPFTLPDTAGLSRSQQVSQFAADVAQALGWDAAPAPGHVDASGEEQLAWLAGRLGTGSDQLRRRCEVFTAHQRILSGYIPGGAPVAAPTLIVSANRSPNAPARARWPHLLRGPVTTVAVDGDHYSFLRPPLVADVGTSFLKWQADHDR
jgi:thioesterase domain-containing protein